jgi:small subunit ribosomal protein S1
LSTNKEKKEGRPPGSGSEVQISADTEPQATAEGEDDFASLLEASFQAASFEIGQQVQGVCVSMGQDVAFIDVGGKGEATIDLEELRDDEGNLDLEVGGHLQAVVVSTRNGLRLSCKLARGIASRRQLSDAHAAGLPVEGRVEKVNKGGYEVRVAGQRAFCPLSLIDTARTEDPAEHEGRTYRFRIIEYKNDGRDLVLSRRAILEEEAREKAEEVLKAVVPGAELTGRVVSLRDYGAFIELGAGVQGLLHVSEMGWSRVAHPGQVVQEGQEITVQVRKVDGESGKISLSLKSLQADPWQKAGATYIVGQSYLGRVTRLAEFGAFVELEPGVEALAHESTFPATKGGWRKTVHEEMTARFRIESVDPERRRIGVSMLDDLGDEDVAASGGPRRTGSAPPAGGRPGESGGQQDGEGFGSLADKLRAAMRRDEDS